MTINNQAEALEFVREVSQRIVSADGTVEEGTKDRVVLEHFMELYLDERLIAKLVCTPTELDKMVIGRLISEGIILAKTAKNDIDNIYICEQGRRAKVYLANAELAKQYKDRLSAKNQVDSKEVVTEPTCCTGNQMLIENVYEDFLQILPNTHWENEWIFAMAEAFSKGSAIHKSTKGTHSCYLGVEGRIVYAAEDLGRHNAMDKCIGHMILEGLAPSQCILFTTGRVPTDMVKKAVAAGIPVLVSKAVPTDAAIEMAKEYHLNLICKAWPDRFVVYNSQDVVSE